MRTILILDDEPSVRESFADYFEDCLWRPIQAESAEDALKLLDSETPLAAVVDIRLPGMDGTDFIREVCRRNIKMVSVICTGSPEYVIPQDLLKQHYVSNRMFIKPLGNLVEIENEILRHLEYLSKEDSNK